MEGLRGSYSSMLMAPSASYVIILLCSIANFINAADRVLMPIAIIPMADEYGWNMHFQGWILSSFSVGYLSSLVRILFDTLVCRLLEVVLPKTMAEGEFSCSQFYSGLYRLS